MTKTEVDESLNKLVQFADRCGDQARAKKTLHACQELHNFAYGGEYEDSNVICYTNRRGNIQRDRSV